MKVMKNVHFLHIWKIHNQTWPCILMTFFNWGDNSERNVESLIIILFFAYIPSLIPPSTVSLTRLVWSSITDTCSKTFGTSCGSVGPSMFTFRQSLTIGYCTTCGWYIIQLYGDFFIWSFIFALPFRFFFNSHVVVPYLITLCLDSAYPTRRVAVFFLTPNMLVKIHSGFLSLGFLTGADVMGDMVPSLVNTSGVETIAASGIFLSWCWSSHLPAFLYNFWCFQDISVHIYHWCLSIGQYQWFVLNISYAVIATYL